MAKDALTVLREARELISDPKRWTRGAFARDVEGTRVRSAADEAVCWCAIGAYNRAAGGTKQLEAFRLLQRASDDLFGKDDPAEVNDEMDHAAVLRMFDAAIASAEKEAQS